MRHIRFVALTALVAAAAPLRAQTPALGGCDPDGPTPSFLSAANEVYYGCGWLFKSTPPQYFQAIGRFQTALTKEPDNAIALYLLGAAWAGYGHPDSARVALERALELDPNVATTLAPRFATARALAAKVNAVLHPAPAAPAPAVTPAPAAPPATPAKPATPKPAPAFKAGDLVDVRVAGSDWVPGTVVSVEDEYGDGSRYLFMVKSRVVQSDPTRETTNRIYPQDIRPRSTTLPAPSKNPAPGGALVYGAYNCVYQTFSAQRGVQRTPQGSLTLRADGTYRRYDNGDSGRYRYDARSGAITWLSGPVADQQPEKTTFVRWRTQAEIQLTLKGTYEWTCTRPLP